MNQPSLVPRSRGRREEWPGYEVRTDQVIKELWKGTIKLLIKGDFHQSRFLIPVVDSLDKRRYIP